MTIAERIAVELSLPVISCTLYDLGLWRLGFEHLAFRLRGERSYPLRYRHGPACL